MFRHGYTYSAHATVAAAALANLDIIERETLAKRAMQLEGELIDALEPLEGHDLVAEVRGGYGVLATVQPRADVIAEDASLPARLVAACRSNGILTRALVTGGLQISPPLIVDDGDLRELREGVGRALDEVAAAA
jgi:adenosylmethionine-8-amino-7-oxononanoate aminotransferase